jgi:hypothetical protein
MLRKQILIKLVTVAVFALLTAPALATEADFQKRMARGVVALEAGNVAAAQEEFRAARAEHPDDPEAALYMAIALNRAGDPAAEAALKNALRMDPSNTRINLELGTFYVNQNMYEEASDYFENVLAQKPDADMAKAAEAYLTALRTREGGKRWGATFLGGVQYDSNVPLAADGSVLPTGTDRRGDWRGVVSLGLTGTALKDSQQELTGSYSLYQTLHLHLNDFNLTQNLFDMTYKRTLTPEISAKISGGFEAIMLGGNQFVNDVTLTPGLFASFRAGMTSGIEYRFRDSFYKNSETFRDNSQRNGVSHDVIISHRQQLGETMNLRLDYTFERDNATAAAWSSNSHRGAAGLGISLPHRMLLDGAVDVTGRRYDEATSVGAEIRSDTTVSGGLSLTWQALERLAVSAGYQYTSNDSNIADYSYTRGVTSLMFQGRY